MTIRNNSFVSLCGCSSFLCVCFASLCCSFVSLCGCLTSICSCSASLCYLLFLSLCGCATPLALIPCHSLSPQIKPWTVKAAHTSENKPRSQKTSRSNLAACGRCHHSLIKDRRQILQQPNDRGLIMLPPDCLLPTIIAASPELNHRPLSIFMPADSRPDCECCHGNKVPYSCFQNRNRQLELDLIWNKLPVLEPAGEGIDRPTAVKWFICACVCFYAPEIFFNHSF